jgi:hypothetical protein
LPGVQLAFLLLFGLFIIAEWTLRRYWGLV